MVRVMASGVFDIIHTGHISYLEQAKAMGDELFVVVASDNTVRKRKHEPVTPATMRVKIVDSLKPVDKAIIGHDGDMFAILEEIRPDIIVLGHDQDFDDSKLLDEMKKRGINAEIRRANECTDDLTGTRRIVKKILDAHGGSK